MDFIGLQMLVTLRNPPGIQVKGTISEVTPGASLVLSNVFTIGSDRWSPRITIEPANIADLSEYKEDAVPNTFPAPGPSPVPVPVPAPAVSQPSQPPPLMDPAIVSLGKRPGSLPRPASNNDAQRPSQPVELPGLQPTRGAGALPVPLVAPAAAQNSTASGSGLEEAMHSLHVDASNGQPGFYDHNRSRGAQNVAAGQANKKKNRKSKTNQAATANKGIPDEAQPNRGKGWRQTPILESTSSFQPFKALKRNGNRAIQDNGFASEDVTEEMGEFDFEGGLAKFDKRTIFDQMRKDDLVEDSERLVSHNRKTKSGTAGGKNLHHTENVLEIPSTVPSTTTTKPKTANDYWNSEADDGVLAAHDAERLSGRDVRSAQSMRRAESKPGTARRSQSRKASGTGLLQQQQQHHHQSTMARTHSWRGPPQPGFYLQPSGRRAETVSALQMLNLENIAANEIGLTEDMMTENAGRGIAQVAVAALLDPAIQVRLGAGGVGSANGGPPMGASAATIVVLAGNNKSGIRAVAAARHLRNKGVNVLACVVGIERERDLLEDMRQQIRIFRNFGGRVHSKLELFEQLRKAAAASTSSSAVAVGIGGSGSGVGTGVGGIGGGAPAGQVTLIVDALLGLAISFEELRAGDQATVYELIEWANRNEAFALAVDVPTGIDPSSGKVSIIDGGSLYVKPRYVVALGAPKRGLLEAMAPATSTSFGLDGVGDGGGGGGDDAGNGGGSGGVGGAAAAEDEEWRLFIADIGLGAAVWKKAGTKLRRGIDFDDKWVLEMRYVGGAEEENDEADY